MNVLKGGSVRQEGGEKVQMGRASSIGFLVGKGRKTVERDRVREFLGVSCRRLSRRKGALTKLQKTEIGNEKEE